MDQVNITAAEVFAEAQSHPYMAVVAVFAVLFVLGAIAACANTASTGAKVLSKTVYYLSAPVHMPLRWAYSRI
tara:strand:+ start:5233 stop:5451 length:219 start_codon:yes stop_codon:yes gene_type:complete